MGLLKDDHPDLHALLSPGQEKADTITSGSGLKMDWICPIGHTYQQTPGHIVAGRRCPYCAGNKILPGFNDLATKQPEKMKEWDYSKNTLDPTVLKQASREKAWWKCPEGHSFQRVIYDHVRKNASPCPVCLEQERQRRLTVDSFAAVYPDFIQFWDREKNDLGPDQVTRASAFMAWWKCSEGHSFKRKVSVFARSQGCPHCLGAIVTPGENDLATTHPEVAARLANPEEGREVAATATNRELEWVCPEGHRKKTTPSRMVFALNKGRPGCSVCSGHEVLPGYNDLATKVPRLIAEWADPIKDATEVTASSEYVALWRCPGWGHEYRLKVAERTRKDPRGCPECASSQGERDLAAFVASILPEGSPLVRHDRKVIRPLELDLYLPGENLAIEYNGVYWHSENSGKDQWYHHGKWASCRDAGVRLLTIWEDDWINNRSLVERTILDQLGLTPAPGERARSTTVVEVDAVAAGDFLDAHHLQGGGPLGSVHYGVIDQGHLVAISSWRRDGSSLYLDRYAASEPVPGGLGRLVDAGRAWARENGCTEIVALADHCVPDDGTYAALGFTAEAELDPDFYYLDGLTRLPNDDPALTGCQRDDLDLDRIWDCGRTRWALPVSGHASGGR